MRLTPLWTGLVIEPRALAASGVGLKVASKSGCQFSVPALVPCPPVGLEGISNRVKG